jgi:LysM repeat protein
LEATDRPTDNPGNGAARGRRSLVIGAVVVVLVVAAIAVLVLTSIPSGGTPPAPVAMAPTAVATRPAAASPTASPTPENAVARPREYVIEPGDSLGSIAVRFDIPFEVIQAANSIDDPDLLFVGRRLIIPPSGATVQSVEPSTTLRELAGRFRAEPAMLAAYNGMEPALIDDPVGREIIVVPGVQSRSATGSPTTSDDQRRYTVEAGDSLLSIAEQFGVEPTAIVEANELDDPDVIQIGQVLTIPGQD